MTTKVFCWEEIVVVQEMIEKWMKQYYSQDEIVDELENNPGIERELTNLVWQKLECQNPAFFQAYTLQLKLRDQVERFNDLVKLQHERQVHDSSVHNPIHAPLLSPIKDELDTESFFATI